MKSDPNKFRKHVHVESALFSQFIAENYLGFFSDIREASEASDYLVDRLVTSWLLLTFFSVLMVSADKAQQWTTNADLDLQSWFVATTGVMYSNTQPLPNSWNPLYKPHIYTVNRFWER